MERLTKRVGLDEAIPICDFDICGPFIKSGYCKTGTQNFPYGMWERHCNDTCMLGRMIDRLCEYEDTGMEPDEVKQLKEFCESQTTKTLDRVYEIAKAEQEGRLFIVPAPGDVLYETDGEHGVVKHTVTDVHWVANTGAVDDNGMAWADYYTEEDIETAHPTREAAEAVLAAGSIMEG